MFDLDDWIRLGFLVLVSFASFSDARIDNNNGGHNSILSRNSVKGANVPASTFLLDWNQLKASTTSTRDELYRMQRHAYMLNPITQQHYKGGIAANIGGQHQFSLFNPFTFSPNEPVPSKTIQPNSHFIPSNSIESTSTLALKTPPTNAPQKLHMAVKPLLPSIPTPPAPEPDFTPRFRSRKFQRKNSFVNPEVHNSINHNHLSKFKVYEAVPEDAF